MADTEAISRSQADKLGEKLRHGEMTPKLIEMLSAYRDQRVRGASDASEAVRALTLYPVTPREGKSTGSIVAKLRRQSVALSRMQDIVGCRIVVDTIVEQDALIRRTAARFPDGRLVDRRLEPTHGYRAAHFIIRWQDQPYEIQIRTRLQHAWAQTVERLSDSSYPDLKYGRITGHVPDMIQGISTEIASIEGFESEISDELDPAREKDFTYRVSAMRAEIIEFLDELSTLVNP